MNLALGQLAYLSYWVKQMRQRLCKHCLQTKAVRVRERLGQGLQELCPFFKSLWRPNLQKNLSANDMTRKYKTYFDLNMLQTLHKIFVLHIQIFWNLSLSHRPKLGQKTICDTHKTRENVRCKSHRPT